MSSARPGGQAFEPGLSELGAFEGTCHSAGAEPTLVVLVEDGQLVLRRRPDWTVTLSPEYADAFDSDELGLVRFRRDPSGRVTELSVGQGRVYDMRFERVDSEAVR